jgi:hypothetical protein
MLSKTRIALSAAMILSTAFSASAATKSHVSHVEHRAIFNMVPDANAPRGFTAPFALEAPDRFGIASQR